MKKCSDRKLKVKEIEKLIPPLGNQKLVNNEKVGTFKNAFSSGLRRKGYLVKKNVASLLMTTQNSLPTGDQTLVCGVGVCYTQRFDMEIQVCVSPT